jgi:hypothetical protein
MPESHYHCLLATIHISAAEAARNFSGLMVKVRAGAEVMNEGGSYPPAVLHSVVPAPGSISECIELVRKHEEETGESPILDPGFAEDVAEILHGRRGTVNSESRRIGFMAGRGHVGPEFFDPLPDDELRLWNCEGDELNDPA